MNILSCSNISKSYIVEQILEDVSFNVNKSDKIGLIGLNGSGKTTLFEILAGKISADSGDIYIARNLKIGYLEQHININSDKTIFQECLEVFEDVIKMEKDLRQLEEDISKEASRGESDRLEEIMEDYGQMLEKFNELNGYGYKSEIRGVLSGLGFEEEDFDKAINILSGGQKSRISLAKLLLEKPDVLMLDEPTNHLDIDAINWLEDFLIDYKGAVMIISHDRYFLDNIVNRIFHLENLGLKIYNTDYSRFMIQRKKDLELMSKQYEDQQKEIKRQEEIIERFKNYGDARYIKQAQSRQKLLDQMKRLDKPGEKKSSKIRFEPKIQSGQDVLSVEGLDKSFGDLKLLEDIKLNIYRGDKVGLIGPNGVGKTTLFKIILGELEYDSGEIRLGSNVVTGYFDQEMESMDPNKTVMDEIWDENPKMTYYDIRTILSQFLFIGDDILKEVRDLSGGEKGRLNLLKLMLSEANFLLMDEPTNHLDIDSKEILESAINDYEGTLLVISHDRYFLNQATDIILELTEDGIVEYMGNYDYYLKKKEELNYVEEVVEEKSRTQIQAEKKKERTKQREEKKLREELQGLEEEINSLEAQLEALDEKLCDPELYEDHEKILKISEERDQVQKELDGTYESWILLTDE